MQCDYRCTQCGLATRTTKKASVGFMEEAYEGVSLIILYIYKETCDLRVVVHQDVTAEEGASMYWKVVTRRDILRIMRRVVCDL